MRTRTEFQQERAAWTFLSPALILIVVFFFLPVLAGLLLSLTDFDIYGIASPSTVRFVGFKNFGVLLSNPDFWKALWNTCYFVIVGGPLSVLVSLGAAILLNVKLVRCRGLFRTIYFAPVVTTIVAVAVVWRYLYHPRYGLLNHALGLLGIAPIDWLGNPAWAMPAIILLAVWKNFGYNMLVFLAGLQSVPEELYEAAQLDGANARQRFYHVTLPGLRPTFIFVSLITMLGYFQLFAEPYVMTQGGPLRATTSVVLLMFEEGFRWWRLGMASTIAFVLLIIMLLGTLLQFRLQRGRR
jgi:multiple sugar transport system permease protein